MSSTQDKKHKKSGKSSGGKSDKSDNKKGGLAVQDRIARQKAKFIDVFRKNMAIVAVACRKVNISRQTFYEWYHNDKVFAAQIDEIKEETGEFVESRLKRAILNDNITAIIFYLKSKHPEYKPKHQIDFGEGYDELKEELKQLLNDTRKKRNKKTS